MRTVTRAFAWQGVRIIPGARILTQPAGPPGGLISRTAFWAQNAARILAPRALHLAVGCLARGPRLWAAFWARNLGPKIKPPEGGVRQRFSCPVSRSKSSSSTPTPTSFHTRRRRCLDRRPHQTNVKRQCVPHAEAHTSISNSPKRRQQAESRKQPARGLSKQAAGNKQTTAGSRESA